MSDEDDWPEFAQTNLRPIMKAQDAEVSRMVDIMFDTPAWDISELE